MNARFPIPIASDPSTPLGLLTRAGESRPDLRSPLPALHVKQGVRIFKDHRADYDFFRLQQVLAWGAYIYCCLLYIAAIFYLPAWARFIFFALAALTFGLGLFCRRRADSILQRSMAASLVEEGPDVLAEAA